MDRVGLVFLATLALGIVVSVALPERRAGSRITTSDVDFSTTPGFAIGSAGVVIILIALYATWW
jgi:SSS family solute:Na+ symporter